MRIELTLKNGNIFIETSKIKKMVREEERTHIYLDEQEKAISVLETPQDIENKELQKIIERETVIKEQVNTSFAKHITDQVNELNEQHQESVKKIMTEQENRFLDNVIRKLLKHKGFKAIIEKTKTKTEKT